jgi:phosphatidylglycerol:prolipoprotein diacylglycerol transferase
MHFPIDIGVGSIHIPAHFVFDVLSVALGLRYYQVLRKREPDTIHETSRSTILVAGAIGAVIGARLLAFSQALPDPIVHELGFAYLLLGGKTIVGALAGGIIGVEITKWITKQKRSTGDILTFPLIYGIMIGRVGCFLTGVTDDTAGIPSSLPWAMDQGDGILRHPTALYEILFLGILWVILVIIKKKTKLKEGILFRLFIMSYFTFRLLVDFLKPAPLAIAGYTPIQIVCLVFALWYAIDIIRIHYFNHGSRTANSLDTTNSNTSSDSSRNTSRTTSQRKGS